MGAPVQKNSRIERPVAGDGRDNKAADDKENLDAQPAGFQQIHVHFGERPLQGVRHQNAQGRDSSQILNRKQLHAWRPGMNRRLDNLTHNGAPLRKTFGLRPV